MAGRKPLRLIVVPCRAVRVLVSDEYYGSKGELTDEEEPSEALYHEFPESGKDFYIAAINSLKKKLPDIFPSLSFDIRFSEKVQEFESFEFSQITFHGKEEEPEIALGRKTEAQLQEIYKAYSESYYKDKRKRLANRVALIFWGLYRLEAYRLAAADTPYMWTQALRELFSRYKRNSQRTQKIEAFMDHFVHELAHTFEVQHHEKTGPECTMAGDDIPVLCEDCQSDIEFYLEHLK